MLRLDRLTLDSRGKREFFSIVQRISNTPTADHPGLPMMYREEVLEKKDVVRVYVSVFIPHLVKTPEVYFCH